MTPLDLSIERITQQQGINIIWNDFKSDPEGHWLNNFLNEPSAFLREAKLFAEVEKQAAEKPEDFPEEIILRLDLPSDAIALVISDLHITRNADHIFTYINQLIAQTNATHLIIDGDFADGTYNTDKCLADLSRNLKRLNLDITLLFGNHDKDKRFERAKHGRAIPFYSTAWLDDNVNNYGDYCFLSMNGNPVAVLTHGHGFDADWKIRNDGNFYHSKTVKFFESALSTTELPHKALRHILSRTNERIAANWNRFYKEGIPLIFGHTHSAQVSETTVNTGQFRLMKHSYFGLIANSNIQIFESNGRLNKIGTFPPEA